MVLVSMDYQEGQFVITAHSDQMTPLIVHDRDLDFDPDRILHVKISDVDMEALWCGPKYDEWLCSFLGLGKK